MATAAAVPTYLPTDNASATPAAAQALRALSASLGEVLRLDAGGFWDRVSGDASVAAGLDTYLQFRRRAHDADAAATAAGAGSEESLLEDELARRVLVVLVRLARAERGAPRESERAAALLKRRLLDVPVLIDLCTLFGASNRALCAEVVAGALKVQPQYERDLATTAAASARNVDELSARCLRAIRDASGGPAAIGDVSEAASYFHDTAESLGALLAVHPGSAPALLRHGGEALLPALAGLHDAFAPAAARYLQHPAGRKHRDGLQRMSRAIVALAWGLLLHGPLREGERGGVVDNGEALLGALLSLTGSGGNDSDDSLVQALERAHGVSAVLLQRHAADPRSLDGAQLEYLLQVLGVDPQRALERRDDAGPAPTAAPPAAPKQPSISPARRALADGIRDMLPDYGVGFLAVCLDAFDDDSEKVLNHLLEGSLPAHLASLDTTMETLPAPPQRAEGGKGKGKGKAPVQDDAPPPRVRDTGKGKGKAADAGQRPPAGPSAGGSSAGGSSGSGGSGSRDEGGISFTGRGEVGRQPTAARRPTPASPKAARHVEGETARLLDWRSADDAASIRAYATAMQYDYDDEYDDSFDELGVKAADGGMDELIAPSGPKRGPQQAEVGPSSGTPAPDRGSAGGRGAGRGGRGGRGQQGSTFWVSEGKVYHSKKEGAEQIAAANMEEAARIAAARHAEQKQMIHGLGAGGNRAALAAQEAVGEDGGGERPGTGGGRGGKGGRGGGGGGGGRGSFANKDKHKASIANHHRKDRAAKKRAVL